MKKYLFILLLFIMPMALSVETYGQAEQITRPTKPTKPTTTNKPQTPTQKPKPRPTEEYVPPTPPPPPPRQVHPSDTRGYEYVDLGLSSGLKWATCNLGASHGSDFGDYYCWGETSPVREKMYVIPSNPIGNTDYKGNITGKSSYDAATSKWGGTWRLPTRKEWEELLKSCSWSWTTWNGTYGYQVTGPNGNWIFLPAAGKGIHEARLDTDKWFVFKYQNETLMYQSAESYSPGQPFYMELGPSDTPRTSKCKVMPRSSYPMPVRPVSY